MTGDKQGFRTRVVLPGWTAWRWSNLTLGAAAVILPLGIALGLMIVITRSWVENPYIASLIAASGLVVAFALFAGLMMIKRGHKELAAGYTTGSGVDLQYDEVDGPTGLVVRESGAPAISSKERRNRVAAYLAQRAEGGGEEC